MSNEPKGTLPPIPGKGQSEAALTLVPKVSSEFDLKTAGPKFMARKQLPKAKRAQLKKYAEDLLASQAFDVEFFISMIKEFDIDSVPGLDAMLENTKLHDAGELGKRVQDTTSHMRKVDNAMPEVDLQIAEKIRQGKIVGKKLLRYIRAFADEIKKAIQAYESVLEHVERNVQFLENKYKLMMEAVQRSDMLAEEADERTEKLLHLCAVLEYMQDEMADRMKTLKGLLEESPNPQLESESKKLTSLAPLIIKRNAGMKPMIHVSGMNIERFVGQRNSFAMLAIDLGDLIELAIPQWKTDIVIELGAAQAQVMSYAIQEALDIFNDQADRASDAYKQQMEETARMMSNLMIKTKTFEKMQESIIQAGEVWVEGVKKAAKQGDKVARLVEEGRNEVKEAQDKLREELAKIIADEAPKEEA